MLICSTFVNRTDNITELYLAFFFWIRFYYLMQRVGDPLDQTLD